MYKLSVLLVSTGVGHSICIKIWSRRFCDSICSFILFSSSTKFISNNVNHHFRSGFMFAFLAWPKPSLCKCKIKTVLNVSLPGQLELTSSVFYLILIGSARLYIVKRALKRLPTAVNFVTLLSAAVVARRLNFLFR